ncbi:MAG: type II and III secretion system protein [Puniceicoccales bacterium]|jgi:general secretion pathway protein D|nr:type II and III secretion system protein [Puniceicoccales bacterium]
MNKSLRLKKVLASILVAAVPTTLPVAVVHAQEAEDGNARFTNLILEAYSARDKGDLALAKAKAEEALKVDPTSAAAKELVAEADKAAAVPPPPAVAPQPPLPPPPPPPLAVPPSPSGTAVAPATPLDAVASKHEALYTEVQMAKVEADQLARAGRYVEALLLLDNAEKALPSSAGAQPVKDSVIVLRQQIIALRDHGGLPPRVTVAAEQLLSDTKARNDRLAAEALALAEDARGQIRKGLFDDAQATLTKAFAIMPPSIALQDKMEELRKVQSLLYRVRMEIAVQEQRDIKAAEHYLGEYVRINGKETREYYQLEAWLSDIKKDPAFRNITESSPGFAKAEPKVEELIIKGRSQYLYGDFAGAKATFGEVLLYQPHNTVAKTHIIRVNEVLARSSSLNRNVTRSSMLNEVDEKWKSPEVFDKRDTRSLVDENAVDPVLARMRRIHIPMITLQDAHLNKAIELLSEISQTFDPERKGVNMVTFDPEQKNPQVRIIMRNVSLDRVLDLVTKTVGFSYTINNGIVEVRPDVGSSEVETEIFPVNPTAVTRMTGLGSGAASGAGNSAPGGFAPAAGATPIGGGASPQEEAIKSYLQRSGVSFEVKDSALAFDGTQIIITQNRRNLERIRNILRRYNDIKQVHVDVKFLEVIQSQLKQIVNNWRIERTNAFGVKEIRSDTGLRSLHSAWGPAKAVTPGAIVTTPSSLDPTTGLNVSGEPITQPITTSPPAISNSLLGSETAVFDGVIGTIGSWDLRYILQAIEASEGSDMMAAPSLTVLDGKTATIRIAQALRYPENYGQTQSQTSNNGGSNYYGGGGNSSVTITAGQPQDFVTQDIGVNLEITPTVAKEDDTISLTLKPKVVDFEGFVEYGGVSVAIAGNTTVTVPSGFYQPVFSIREITTDVTIFDGSTIVIGGLMREEVKTVEDKIPVLGDLPLLGAAFRSKGKTVTKKNLMVFVTANLISPGGGLLKRTEGTVGPATVYANPTLLTPAGEVHRVVIESRTSPTTPPAAQ